MRITAILIPIVLLLASCTLSEPTPAEPIVEFNGEVCTVTYNSNEYKATVTHIFQGITSMTFIEPDSLNGIVYSFSENGCNIMLGDLTFNTDRSFMGDMALPQLICDVLNDAQAENALTYTAREEPPSSTLTEAVFTGKTNSFNYTVITDFNSGYIREIDLNDCDLRIRFSNK